MYFAFLKHLLFLQDEDVYTFFEPVLPVDNFNTRSKALESLKLPSEKRSSLKLLTNRNGSKSSHSRTQRPLPDKRTSNHNNSGGLRRPSPSTEKSSWNVLDLKVENYYSCAVGRTRTNARYQFGSPDDVVSFLKELAELSL